MGGLGRSPESSISPDRHNQGIALSKTLRPTYSMEDFATAARAQPYVIVEVAE
jgi:hypothetical protein